MTDRAPCGAGFVTLLEGFRASGGTAPSEVVGRLLAEYQVGEPASLVRLLHTGQVFGFEWRSGLWIPMFQFNASDLSATSTSQAVRAELPELWSGWTVAMWFAMPNCRLEDRRPVDLLASDPTTVLHAAESSWSADSEGRLQVQPERKLASVHA